jgi:hypothetical protein
VCLLMGLKPGQGVLFAAPVCSSWVWMNRGSSGRSLAEPLGFEHRPHVQEGNLQVARLVLLLLLCHCFDIGWVVEQPGSSLLHAHPRFEMLCRMITVYEVRFQMGHYGSASQKPTILYSNSETLLQGMKNGAAPRGQPLVKKYVDKSGIKRVIGNTQLKWSQTYPKRFGSKMAQNYKIYQERKRITKRTFIQEPLKSNTALLVCSVLFCLLRLLLKC